MSIITPSGKFITDETGKSIVVGVSTDQWSQKTSWSTYRKWIETATDLKWLTPGLDLGSVVDFVIVAEISCIGTPTYRVYTSNTGAFAGEETTISITTTSSLNNVYFTGRYVMIGIEISANESEGIPVLESFNYTASTRGNMVYLNDVYTGDLDGEISAKQLELPKGASKVVNISITAHRGDGWVEPDYFTPYDDLGYPYLADEVYIEEPKIPVAGIVSKTAAAPKIAFTLNEEFTQSTFDAQLYVLPVMSVSGKNIIVS